MTTIEIDAIAESLGVSKSAVFKRASREIWAYAEVSARGGKKRQYNLSDLPSDIQAKVTLHLISTGALTPSPQEASTSEKAGTALIPPSVPVSRHRQTSYDRDSLWSWYDSRPQTIKDEGTRRAGYCLQVRNLIDAGIAVRHALAEVARKEIIAPATLKRWWYGDANLMGAANVDRTDYAAALAPRYAGGEETAEMSQEAWDWIYADWMRPEQPSVAAVYRRVKVEAVKHGWDLPSLATVKRRLLAIDWKRRVLAREGEAALLAALPHVTRSKSHLHAMQAVNADGHVFDVRVKLPSGDIGRPVMVAWQDLYSGKILSYRISETLNWHTVRLSFGDMVEKYGIPQEVFLDNGREFANKFMSGRLKHRFRFTIKEDEPDGVFSALGINVRWTTPYHGQSKPIEKAWKDLCIEGIAKHPACAGAYTGNKPTNKPANYGEKAMEWEDFHKVVKQAVIEHNSRQGRRTETAKQRSFDITFEESRAQSSVPQIAEHQRRLLLLAAEGVKVQKGGHIQLQNNRYWNDHLGAWEGKKVVARFDPDDLTLPAHLYSLSGEYLGEVITKHVNFIDSESASEHNRQNKRKIKAEKLAHKAELKMAAIEEQQRIPDVVIDMPKQRAGSIVPLFEKTQKVANGLSSDDGLGTDDRYILDLLSRMPRRTEEDF